MFLGIGLITNHHGIASKRLKRIIYFYSSCVCLLAVYVCAKACVCVCVFVRGQIVGVLGI